MFRWVSGTAFVVAGVIAWSGLGGTAAATRTVKPSRRTS
jgi:hypothetical protein